MSKKHAQMTCNENQLHPSPKGRLIFSNFLLGI
jgi:hypothetical protein